MPGTRDIAENRTPMASIPLERHTINIYVSKLDYFRV